MHQAWAASGYQIQADEADRSLVRAAVFDVKACDLREADRQLVLKPLVRVQASEPEA